MTVQNHCQRKAPFLHRNWIRGLKAWQTGSVMGNVVSSPGRKEPHSGGDDDGAPPYKRRRTSSPDSHDIDHLIASPTASDSRPSLRLEILKVSHKDSKKVKSFHGSVPPRDVLTTQASCRVTISDVTSHPPRVVQCQNQKCDIITFKNPVGPHRIARVNLPRPFFIPEDGLLVNRADDGTYDLSDAYQLVVELESTGGTNWPPLEVNCFGNPAAPVPIPPPDTTIKPVLSSRFDRLFGRLKNPVDVSQGYPSHQMTHQTDYVMDVDMRWTAGFKALKRLDKGSMPSITAIDPDAEPLDDSPIRMSLDEVANGVNGINGLNGHLHEESSHENEDELDGDQTPSRSLRTRETNKVYNLKVLSDQAQGREKKRRGRASSVTANEGRVTYFLPSDQPVCLDFFRCVSCGAYHESMPQLRIHLETFHPSYQYVLETTGQGPQFRVTPLNDSLSSSPSKTYQLGRPNKPFNLQTWTAGDQSWAASRITTEGYEELLKSPTPKAFKRLQSQSPAPKLSRPLSRRAAAKPKAGKILVPESRQPLFDPISKVRLRPGQEVPRSKVDDSWLIQKHLESIGDFSDVTSPEKEYIWEWDGFILKQNITSAAYFPRVWLDFVQQTAPWLVAAEHRMIEFGKHASSLFARDALEDDIVQDAFVYINKARTGVGITDDDRPADTGSRQSPKASQIRKSRSGCTVCQLPVHGPRQLVCASKACLSRLYHSDCIKDDALTPVDRPGWLCNTCSEV